ncbi:uncharacterized protein LOC134236278 [Saccostrea cucullata]|uniref:uncharacterized protein LOC134236278 n=1 Tax=Saccostrea cuccullata TaxID=36930 RepID=UPI002ED1219B
MPAGISDLPDEVLLMIFSYLAFYDIVHSIKLVCSRWRNLSNKRCLWNTIGAIKWVTESLEEEDFLGRAKFVARNLEALEFLRIRAKYSNNSKLASNIEKYATLYSGPNQLLENDDDDDEDSSTWGFNGPLVFLREDVNCPNLKGIHLVNSDLSLTNFLKLLEKYSFVTEVTSDQNAYFDLDTSEMVMPAVRKLPKLERLTIIECEGTGDFPDFYMEEGIVTFNSRRWNAELQKIVIAHPELTYLNISLSGRSEQTIRTIFEKCPNLKSLKILGNKMRGTEEIKINVALASLEELVLDNCYLETQDFKNIISSACASKMLQKLTLLNCTNITEEVYQIISDQCPILKKFIAREDEIFYKSRNQCFYRRWENTFINDKALIYLSTCRHLQELSIGDSSVSAVTDEGICALAQGCTQLRVVNLSGCQGITDLGVMELAHNCQGLHVVDLSGCHHITGFGFSCVVMNCPWLQEIPMRGCHALKEIVLCKEKRFPEMPVGSLNQISEETNATDIQCNCSTFCETRICPKIISGQQKIKSIYGITDADIKQSATENQQNDSAVKVWDPPLPFHSSSDHSWIQTLELSNCSSISDSDILKICQFCPEIRGLDLAFNCKLTDKSILAVSKYLTLLNALILKGIYQLTNNSLVALAKRGLISLSFQACPKITIYGLRKFLTMNRTLQKMSIHQNKDGTAVPLKGNNINDLLEELSNDYILFVMQNDEKANRINIETSRIMEDELMF